jgi:transglutaminase-like putative cysteine protease
MGICLDIAAMTTGMLRAVATPANLIIGWADDKYHAWVEARIEGQRYLYDHDDPKGQVKTYKRERMY